MREPDSYHFAKGREMLRMARAYPRGSKMRVIYEERAADHRECVIDRMRKAAGWTLAERVAGNRLARHG